MCVLFIERYLPFDERLTDLLGEFTLSSDSIFSKYME